ncbi:hypothetical protein CHS0354_020017 [Potamilus streckersoni]|uniref:Ig-like domain-containing protein n=1 Tax=Potamilus streckersoni TaxID=2493646 RepID=A0AAE0S6S3_9BIVA|nr:hypothetical protein CHS0354_020017 [Potamilus streckersoni]
MKYLVQIFVYFVIHNLPYIGTVTIGFNSIGYIGESIVLQCQDTPPITAVSATWYRRGSIMDISSSRYSQTITPTGFNLTISSLVTANEGEYHCVIGFDISSTKDLSIYYNTKDVNITQLYPKAIEITFIAFPDPVYVATVKEDGVQLDVNWNIYKSALASGAIQILLRNSTAFTSENKIYTVHMKITSPLSLDVEKDIIWVDDCPLEFVLGLDLGVGLGNGVICVICVIFIVILVKRVNIQAKDKLQKPNPEGSEVTITAFVHGFCIPRVQWTGPHGNVLTSNGKYNIQYYRNTGTSTLQISALKIDDSGLYTCLAIGICRSSAQDSVGISVYDASHPNQDATVPNQGASTCLIVLGFGIMCVAGIVFIVILAVADKPSALRQGLSLGLGLGIPFVISIIFIVFRKGVCKFIHGLGLGIRCVASFVFIMTMVSVMILVMRGRQCVLKLGLGLGLVLGIPIVGCIIVIVILVKKVFKSPPAHKNRRGNNGRKSDVSRMDAEIQMEEKGVKSNEASGGAALSREHVQFQMEEKGVNNDDE